MKEQHSVAVIGAGFSGTILASHLLRRSHGGLRIYLINRSGRLARGVAYGTRNSRHVLNVPAGRMSAFADDENDFLRFAQQRDPNIAGGSFVPRHLYGDYLEHILLSAQSKSARGTVLAHVADEVLSIDDAPANMALVTLAHHTPLMVDHVVIAAGNYAPATPWPPDEQSQRDPRFVIDPWKPLALDGLAGERPIAIIGTGLTMVDVALDLAARGHTGGMVAISRRGLLPQPHRHGTTPPAFDHLPPDITSEATAVGYLKSVRRHVRRLEREGVDWREVVASLRPVTPDLWRALPVAEKKRFLRHLRPYWEVHRHRMAPELWSSLEALITSGALQVVPARLTSVDADDDGLWLTMRRRERTPPERLRVAALVNCTGPEADVRRLQDPLVTDLLRRGTASADPTGLGLRVDGHYRLMGKRDIVSGTVSLTGPLLKGEFWEATAVPELRVHAARLAERLAILTAIPVTGDSRG